MLLRYLNAGMDEHDMGILGLPQTRIAQDGVPRSANFGAIPAPQNQVVEALPSGATADDIVDVSSMTTAGERIPVYDTGKPGDPAGHSMSVMLHAGTGNASTCSTAAVNPTGRDGLADQRDDDRLGRVRDHTTAQPRRSPT